MNYIMAVDAGSTHIKAAIFDQEGKVTAWSQRKAEVYFPKAGFVEQDPDQIYRAVIEAIQDTMAKAGIASNQVTALGITNQRINVIMWDARTGRLICNAMSWQDQRGPDMMPGFMAKQTVEYTIASLFAGKILWLYKEIPDLRSRMEAGEVVFGGVDTWLLWKLTGGQVHATDVSNASTTILYDLSRSGWNTEILAEANIPVSIFPKVMDSSHIFGYVSTPDLDLSCPIASVAADQHASLFGHRCFCPGQAKATFGTGSFVLANMGSSANPPPPGIVKHAAWSLHGQTTFALEGSILDSGSALEWLMDGMGLVGSLDDLDTLAASVDSSAGVCFVPALSGLGSPSWDTRARGLLIGLTRATRKGHIARAALNALAFQVREITDLMGFAFSGAQSLHIDGRPAMNACLVQTLADTCQVTVARAVNYNATLTGAAYLAGLSAGVWPSLEAIENLDAHYDMFSPQRDMEKEYGKWLEAVRRSRSWLD